MAPKTQTKEEAIKAEALKARVVKMIIADDTNELETLIELKVEGGAGDRVPYKVWREWRHGAGWTLADVAREHRADKCRKLLEEAAKSFQPATPASSAKKPAVSGPEPELSEEAAAAKVDAFKAVMKDDVAGLEQLLDQECAVGWESWRNKGKKTLEELAAERSKQNCHAFLLKALERVRELAPEEVDVGDAVWVFEENDLQPKKATCLDVESERVRVTLWDEEKTSTHWYPRGRIRRMNHH